MKSKLKDALFYLFPLIYFIFFVKFVYQNTSNILYGDEWDNLYKALSSFNLIQFLNYSQGGHPIAFGLIVIILIGKISHWSVYWGTTINAIFFLINLYLILWLKRKLFGQFEFTDLFYPLIFLNVNQWEGFVHGDQIGFILTVTAFLVFLIIINLKNLSFKKEVMLLTIIPILCSRLTMQGLIVALFIHIYLLFKYYKTNYHLLVLSTIIIQWLLLSPIFYNLFLNHNKYIFLNKTPSILTYITFISYQLNILLGFGRYQFFKFLPFPLFIFSLIAIFFVLFLKERKKNMTLITIVFFYLYSLIFTAITTLTRSGIGYGMAQTTRYIPQTIFYIIGSGFFFSYLIKKYNSDFLRTIYFIFLTFVFVLMLNFSYISSVTAATKKKSQDGWMQCYVKTKDINYCNYKTKYSVFYDTNSLKKYLDFLEKNHYSYFSNYK